MKFNDSFENYMSLYNEAKEAPKGKHYDKAGRLQSGDADSDGDGGPKFRSDPTYKNPNENEEKSEDNETAKKIGKGALKLAGRAALGTAKLGGKAAVGVADYVTHGDFSDTIKTIKKAYLPGDVEDCETCGCEENPEYGHLDDTYSNYIDQYEPKEDCESCGCEDAEAGCECGNCPDCTPKEDAERIDKDRMKCNSPKRGGSKKFVVKACENGKEKIVRFGDPNMRIKKSNPKARKSFRARHKCDQKKSKFSAGYWSCKKW